MTKAELRAELARRRDAVPADKRLILGKQVAARVVTLPEWEAASVVGLYVPVKSEVPTAPLLVEALRAGKRVAVPKVVGDHFEYREVKTFDDLAPGSLGVPEPVDGERLTPDVVVVPGLGFDPWGGRIGYGRGFFDRALAEYDGFAVAAAYDFQVLARLPTEEHDVPVHAIATAERLMRCAHDEYEQPEA